MAFIPFKGARMREAIENGDTAAAKALLARGVEPDITDDFGRSFLWHAVHRDRRDIAEALIAAGARLDETDGNSANLLHVAARRGRVELAARLVALCPQLVRGKDGYGETPLHAAAEAGHDDVAALLIEKKADLYAKNNNGRNALFLAQRENRADTAALLRKAMTPEADNAAPVAPGQNAGGDWRRLSEDRIAHVTIDAAIGYRITEIFNFAARERTTLYQNMETRAESNATRRFEDIGDIASVELAAERLMAFGGSAAVSAALPKKRLPGLP